ncbi:MAG: hypothetical protein IT201_09405 [Thermoleophilia bacterium]|nr:hypothetical protein [Thermoleophilia bacterium]
MGIREIVVFAVGAVLLVIGSLAATGHVHPARATRAVTDAIRPEGFVALGFGTVATLMGLLLVFAHAGP